MKGSLKKRIITLVVAPIILLGLLIIIITFTLVRGALLDEVKESLRGTAAATLAAYDQNSGGYMVAANGDVWKGGYNISKSDSLVDSIKEESGMDVTFFYGDKRVMTSAIDADGNRILGSPAGDVIVEKVLEQGQPYFSSSVSIDGVMNYGYFLPIFAKATDETPVGMIFAGVNKAEQDAAILAIVVSVVAIVVIVMLLCIIVAVIMSNSLIGSLKKSIGQLQTVSTGELGIEIDRTLLKRRDEVGDLSRSVETLQTELRKIVSKLRDNVYEIRASAEELGATSQETTAAMHEVGDSITMISESAAGQAAQSRNASDIVAEMGNKISRTADEVKTLTENAASMDASGKMAADTVNDLININDEVRSSVELVAGQTNQTNISAQKIRKAADIIVGIAEETNLLALNASIEAARAGESGRGFAVVASQIQKLAEQSNESSTEIIQVIDELLRDSAKAVEAMQHVQTITNEQNENMKRTGKIVGEVTEGINVSIRSIRQIGDVTDELAKSRIEIVDTVDALADTAVENEQITRKTNSAAGDVNLSIEQVAKSAEKLQGIAEELSGSMEYFRL